MRSLALISLALLCAASLAPAYAQAPTNPLSSYGAGNSNKPIDIESDRLEVDDKTQIATFIGSVSATQGDYNLKSERLEVTYERKPDEASPAATKKAKPVKASQTTGATEGGDPVSSGQVKTIKAIGAVVVTSAKDDQKATGKEGFFEVKEQKITMSGDVVLVQKGNIVKCDRLNIDLATSRSICIPVGVPDGKGGKKPPRVTAVLKREGGNTKIDPTEALTGRKKKADKTEKQDEPKEQPKPKSGWQTQSQ